MNTNKLKGDNLESFVKKLEELLLPEGLKIEKNKRVYENKTQTGELDLLITGSIGSFSVNWLIECRNRPSDGPQGRNWVQQLIGRKLDYKVDKVVGVSTTGFTESAYMLAKQNNIPLREVKNTEEIADEFSLIQFNLCNPMIKPIGKIRVAKIVPLGLARSKPMENFEFVNKIKLKYEDEKKYQAWLNFFLNHKYSKLFDQNEKTPQFFNFHAPKPLIAKINNLEYRVYNFRAMLCYDDIPFEGKTLALRSYSEDGKIIGQEIAVVFNTSAGPIKMNLMLSMNSEGYGKFDITNFELPEGLKD